MRYLNKIVFINSASVQYAEIAVDGNVHLIGTQGVGKSTLLRAMLFFYNANKTKLGIPKEKKGFDDYYFEYQNSYIVYEINKDEVPYCVLAYKVNGKVAFRFFNAAYNKALFISEDNRALESWDKIRAAFGKDIYYTTVIKSYEDFRRIIYGDNKGLKPEFKKYALIESKQYQNIPRTIQNVLLNTNIEAKFIKDTIINSLNEEEFVIDIENYSTQHLRDFETQINDIKIWFKENRTGQIVIRKQADKIIDCFRVHNFLKREKKDLAYELATRIGYLENEKATLFSSYKNEEHGLKELFKNKEHLKDLHLKREQKLISEIDYLKKELAKAKEKQLEYSNLNIEAIIDKVGKKEALMLTLKTLQEEKTLLTSKFAQIGEKYKALIAQVDNQQKEVANNLNAEVVQIRSAFADNKTALFETYQKVIQQIITDNKEERTSAFNALETIKDKENTIKRRKSELKHKTFFSSEIESCKEDKKQLGDKISVSQSILLNTTNETATLRKEWELEEKELERKSQIAIYNENEKQRKLALEITQVEAKIAQSASALYGWLNDKVPNWQNTIGKVIDQDKVLFNTELNPTLVDPSATSIFGITLNLNTLTNSIKSVKEYQEELTEFKAKFDAITGSIQNLNTDRSASVQKLKTKFKKKLNILKERTAENEYAIAQNQELLKKKAIALAEWITKATTEKENSIHKLDANLDAIAAEKLKAEAVLEAIKKGIKRKTNLKEKERDEEISALDTVDKKKIAQINATILQDRTAAEKRIKELQETLTLELTNKGADTARLQAIAVKLTAVEQDLIYIKDNEIIVIEYNKDKRELFNTVPQLKADKATLEKKQVAIENDHKIALDKINTKYTKQEATVKAIQSKIEEFEVDENTFIAFKKSDTFTTIETYFLEPIKEIVVTRTAVDIVAELNDKYYKGIGNFKELQQATNAFTGNFNENNIFSFRVKLNEDADFLTFASDLKEFVEEDKIQQFEKRVNERFANIIFLIGRETTELNSKKGEIEKIIKKINDDFLKKNFVQAVKGMEMKTLESSNPIVRLLIQIKEFNDENSMALGATNLFTSSDSNAKNEKAVALLKQLVKELLRAKKPTLTLSESFDLQFRIIENNNDSGWVEKINDVGSNGTDILVKAMVNISLLNVFKEDASKKFKDFKLHCMMDEIGTLHPNNQRGILRFANERNILLINGSPTSQNATDYKYTYKLAKEQSKSNAKKYITKINRLVKVDAKIRNA